MKSCINCLALARKDMLNQWDYEQNLINPFNITVGSKIKVWWKCCFGHRWLATPNNRCNKNSRCPYCFHKLPTKETCLEFTNPNLIKEWHPTKNGVMKPSDFLPKSHKRVWWKCKSGHEWEDSIAHRTEGVNCPYCSSRRVCKDNSFGDNSLELLKEWNFSKNIISPYSITKNSNRKVWWKCLSCSFEWIATIKNRSHYTGCPACVKVLLNDGEVCDSLVEAHYYLLYKREGLTFKHSGDYGGYMGKSRYDFFFPNENKYVEVTSYNPISKNVVDYDNYYAKILAKEKYVTNILGATFQFIQYIPTYKDYKFVRENTRG